MSLSEGSPTRPDPASPGVGPGGPVHAGRLREWFRRGSRTVGLILLTFVVWVWVRGMAASDGFLSVDAGVVFAMGLVAAGVLLLRGQQPVYEETSRVAGEPKQRSPLGVLTLSVAFVVVGVMILLSNLEAANISMGQLAAAGLLIVGIGLLVGAWWGRSRFLIVVGIVSIPLVIAGGFLPFPLRGSIGDRRTTARIIQDVPTNYELLVGNVHMNLGGLADFDGEREIDISVAGGGASIYVPQRVALTITGHIEFGNAVIGRGRQEGSDISLHNELQGKPGAGHLKINFTGGIASLYVERISMLERYGHYRNGKLVLPDRFRRQNERRDVRDAREPRSKSDRRGGRRDRAKT